MAESWLGGLVVSPHVVNEGQVLHMEISDPGPWKGGCIGSNGKECVSGYDWQFFGEKVAGCGAHDTSCEWKAVANDAFGTPQWATVQVGIVNAIGSANSEDYFLVLVKGRAISGTVLSSDGKPLAGQEVDISGPSSGHVPTNASGFYNALVRPGSYSVTVGGQKDVRVDSCGPNGSVSEDNCRLDLSSPVSGVADFTVGPVAPEVTGLSTSTGPARGGTELFIKGKGFKGTTSVDFVQGDGTKTPAELLGRVTDSSLFVRVPDQTKVVESAGKSVTEDIVVTVGSVTSSKQTPSDLFTFEWPQVTSVTPAAGAAKGKETLVIKGSGFDGARAVEFVGSVKGGAPQVLKSLDPSSVTDTSITIDEAPDLAPWVAEQADGGAALATDVIVVVPGTGLDFRSPTARPADQYTAMVPQVTSVSPNLGPMEGNPGAQAACGSRDSVAVRGQFFTGADEVLFSYEGETKTAEPLSAPVIVCSDKKLVFVPPDASAALATATAPVLTDVVVSVPVEGKPFGLLSPVNAGDQYTIYPVKVTGVSPATGLINGGKVVISGLGFTGVRDVRFEAAGIFADRTGAKIISATSTSITVDAPDLAAEAGQRGGDGLLTDVVVQVTEPDGQLITTPKTSADHFTYPYPKVSHIVPNSGLSPAGTSVQIFGQGFSSDPSNLGATVEFKFGDKFGNVTLEGKVLDVSPGADEITISTPDVTALLGGLHSAVAQVVVEIHVGASSYSSLESAESTFTFSK